MSALSRILRGGEDNGLLFWCPGCKTTHRIQHGSGEGPRWGWNGDVNKPTFTPSVLVRMGHYAYSEPRDSCWCTYNKEHPDKPSPFTCQTCHSFVTDGRIQFLSDCTHALAGQTVDLPDFDQDES
jgi:hypothetical protein